VRRRIGRPSIPGLLVYVVLIGAMVVGVIVPGGTEDTIVAIAAAFLALAVIGTVGIGKAASDVRDRRGRWGGPPM
jgi:hypothetical protein